MMFDEIPKIDNIKIFGTDLSSIPDGLVPIGCFVGHTYGPSPSSSPAEFNFFIHEVTEHCIVENGTKAAAVRPIKRWVFPAETYVLFMGAYRAVPPRELTGYLSSEYADLLRVIDAGLITLGE